MRPSNPSRAPELGTVVVTPNGGFPAEAGGVIQLLDDTTYELWGNVSAGTAEVKKGLRTIVRGRSFPGAARDCLRSNNSTFVLSQTAGACYVENLNVIQEGAGEAIKADAAAFHEVQSTFTTGGLRLVSGNMNLLQATLNGKGLIVDSTYSDAFGGFTVSNAAFNPGSGEAGLELEAGAAVGFMNVLFSGFNAGAGASGIKVDDPGQILGQARILDGFFLGTGTLLDGVTKGDPTWEFENNVNVADSADQATASFTSAGTTIDLDVPGTWRTVDGTGITWGIAAGAEKFMQSSTVTGQLTHTNGLTTSTYLATASFTFERSGGSNVDVEFGISVNGADPVAVCVASEEATNKPQTFSTPLCLLSLATGNTVQLMVRSADGSGNDIDALDATLTVFK